MNGDYSNNLHISCIALAGGKSTRLGRNKLTETIGNKTLLERVLDTLSSFDSEIIIVTSAQSALPANLNYPKMKIVNDIYPGNAKDNHSIELKPNSKRDNGRKSEATY